MGMRSVVQSKIVSTSQFLNDRNGGILQVIPLGKGRVLVVGVKEFKEFEYSLEGPVPFSGDKRLAFNRIPDANTKISNNGFRLIGREYNRIARLSGTNDPEIIKTFRTRLIKGNELLTFHRPVYKDAGHVISNDSMEAFTPARSMRP